ncbi:hypothetical protein [Prosthecochloris sp.]|jgi:modified peptide precursor CbpA|nr:hypothetical protein [Prosthecochloris sp.]
MKQHQTTQKNKTVIIARRKRSSAKGTGLSHYILIEKPSEKKEHGKKA